MSEFRRIGAIPLPAGLKPCMPASSRPAIAEVRIDRLLVDPAYQRDLNERSVRLIHKIVREWDWRRFKPPVVVAQGEEYLVIDGQHTAIAAASHGGIGELPVMLVEMDGQAEQAGAFLGHNRDRVNITNAQLFFAALAAGEEAARDAKAVCDRAGAKILRNATPGRAYRAGEIAAITSLMVIVRHRTAMQARRVVETCVKSGAAPIGRDLMKAVDELINGQGYTGEIADEDIAATVLRLGPELDRAAGEIALAKRLPKWRALAIVIFQKTRKRRGSAIAH